MDTSRMENESRSGWCESRMHVFMDEHGQETSGKVFKDEQGAPM